MVKFKLGDNMDKVMEIAKRRGFLWPSFEIYEGLSGFYDYGPLGVLLKRKIIEKWREYYTIKEGFYEVETPNVMPKEVLKASGHVDHFNDPMTKCKDCSEIYRADHLIKDETGEDVEGLSNEKLTEIISKKKIRCPKCGGHLSHVWSYNLMFQTLIGPTGKKVGYLRPETAQGIFVLFKRLMRFYRNKLPFGVVQIGKSFRNEISPRQGVIRLREFTQAEAEIFVEPDNKTHPKFHKVADEKLKLFSAEKQLNGEKPEKISLKEAVDENIISSELLAYHLYLTKEFLTDLGIPEEMIRFRQHLPSEMAHYAADCWDAEVYMGEFGWIEVVGIADRTNYDLKSHMESSGEDLRIFVEYEKPKLVKKVEIHPRMDKIGPRFKEKAKKILKKLKNMEPEKIKKELSKNEGKIKIKIDNEEFEIYEDEIEIKEKRKYIKGKKVLPHVIEPSFGIDRIFYATMIHNFVEDDERTYFDFPADIAPIPVAVFPLLNKKELINLAIKIKKDLQKEGLIVNYDESGTIGRRYARADEIGIPFAITVDHQSIEDGTVTIRNRSDKKQVRIAINKIPDTIKKLIKGDIKFHELFYHEELLVRD